MFEDKSFVVSRNIIRLVKRDLVVEISVMDCDEIFYLVCEEVDIIYYLFEGSFIDFLNDDFCDESKN